LAIFVAIYENLCIKNVHFCLLTVFEKSLASVSWVEHANQLTVWRHNYSYCWPKDVKVW